MRSSRLPDLFDRVLWSRAGWSRVEYIVPTGRPPVLALVFRDSDAACTIFAGWHAALGEIDVDDLVRVAVIDVGDDGAAGRYHVHLGFDPQALGRQAARTGREVVAHAGLDGDVWCRAVPLSQVPMQRFLERFAEHDRYLLVPASMDGGFAPIPQLGIGKQLLAVRHLRDIRRDGDPDAVIWRHLADAASSP